MTKIYPSCRKSLKGWLRTRKLERQFITTNPLWKDLSEDWGKQAEHL